jgi:hypothetical protein
MLSLFCTASMLPCGRYYYEPEGGYVGNPWVKFSYQYVYLYLIWILHHLDLIDYYIFDYSCFFISQIVKLKTHVLKKFRVRTRKYINFNHINVKNKKLFNKNYFFLI